YKFLKDKGQETTLRDYLNFGPSEGENVE
ncbi:TPA: tandem-type lipoprotein, partial [Staphylococcus aureus]|nr:tandem-type lipoprotein [Staphylococcus aureus]